MVGYSYWEIGKNAQSLAVEFALCVYNHCNITQNHWPRILADHPHLNRLQMPINGD